MSNLLGRLLRYVFDGFQYAASPFNKTASRRVGSLLASTANYNRTRGTDGQLDHFAQLGITNPYLYAGAALIASRVSDVSLFKVEERQHGGRWIEVKDHAFAGVLARPNSIMTGEYFLGLVPFWEIFYGNCYWLFDSARPGMGEIREIWPLPAKITRPRPELIRYSTVSGELTIDYEYLPGELFTLPGENVAHFKTVNIFDYWMGLSALTALQHNLGITYNQSNWLADFYGKNNAVPTSVISVPPELSDDELRQIKLDIIEQFGGQRRTAITRAGEMDVEVIQHTVADMELLQAQDHYAKEVRTVLNIPEGLSSASSGQARLAAETALARDAVQPLLNHIAGVLTTKAMPFYGRHHKYRVTAENVVPQDDALEVTKYGAYSKHRTLNENREQLKQPPLRFSGALAPLQQLLDEVPTEWIPLIAPVLLQNVSGASAAPGKTPHQDLIEQLVGRGLVDALSGQGRNAVTVVQPAGLLADGEVEEANYRTTGQESQTQLLDHLVGAPDTQGMVATLTGAEKATLEQLFHGWQANV